MSEIQQKMFKANGVKNRTVTYKNGSLSDSRLLINNKEQKQYNNIVNMLRENKASKRRYT